MLKKWKRWLLFILVLVLILNIANIARLFYPAKYIDQVKISSRTHDVDPYLILAIIKSESNFRHDAVSHKNASGLMQIMEPTAKWLAEKMELPDFDYADILNPEQNIDMGCYYMAYLLELYGGNEQNALAAYNAGEGTVSGWLQNPAYSKDGKTLSSIPYPETETYVSRVLRHKKMYERLYEITSAD